MKHRTIVNPVRLTGTIHPQQLAALVSIDAMIRRRTQLGGGDFSWDLSTLAGDIAVQRAVQRVVAREGDDRDELGREGFAERANQVAGQAEVDLDHLLAMLAVRSPARRWNTEDDNSSRAARVAFVRLFDAGALRLTDTVVDSCPSCESVVDHSDTDIADTEVDQYRIALLPIEDLFLDLIEPELLVGAVAVAVPEHIAVGETMVFLPLAEREVPIVRVDDVAESRLVIPGHDNWSQEIARQLNLPAIEVLDGEGVVRHPGVLEGLGRYAARTAAIERLSNGGYITGHNQISVQVRRCYRCGTPVIPLFGRHWLLDFRPLVDAAMEQIVGGAVAFSPAGAMQRLQSLADQTGAWVVSQQLWSGHPIPVSNCLDCGRVEVTVDEIDSCKSCMGAVRPARDVLDARFIAAVTPIAMTGWPAAMEEEGDVETTLMVGRFGLDLWALPMAALGIRLGQRIPFQQVIVKQNPIGAPDRGQQSLKELAEWVDTLGTAQARIGVLMQDSDVQRNGEIWALLTDPPAGEHHLDDVRERFDKALLAVEAAEALSILVVAAQEGVHVDSRRDWADLVTSIVGE